MRKVMVCKNDEVRKCVFLCRETFFEYKLMTL